MQVLVANYDSTKHTAMYMWCIFCNFAEILQQPSCLRDIAGITGIGIGIMDMSGGGMDTGDTGCRYHRQNTD